MVEASVERELGRLDASVDALKSQVRDNERDNERAHDLLREASAKATEDILNKLDDVHKDLNAKIKSLNDELSIYKTGLRLLRLLGYMAAMALVLKFGDAKTAWSEILKVLR